MKNKTLIGCLISFLLGGGAGFGVSYYIYKKETTKRFFDEPSADVPTKPVEEKPAEEYKIEEPEEKIEENEAFRDFMEDVASNKYDELRAIYGDPDPVEHNEIKPKKSKKRSGPKYEDITEETFNRDDEYDKQVITLYADGYMYDEAGQQVHPTDTVGRDRFSRFLSANEEDRTSIHVRNNYISTDFELIYDPRDSKDVIDYNTSEEFDDLDDFGDFGDFGGE